MIKLLRGSLAVCLLAGPLTLTGCWDLHETEDFAHAALMAIDKGASPGSIRVTLLVQEPLGQPGAAPGSAAGSAVGFVTATAEGPSLFAATERIKDVTDRVLTYTHVQVVIFGEDLAREGLTSTLDALLRSREFRRSVLTAVADGVAGEAILETVRGDIEVVPSAYLGSISLMHLMTTGHSVAIRLHDVAIAYSEPGEEVVMPLLSPAPKPPAPAPPGKGGGGGGGQGGGSDSGGGAGSAGGSGGGSSAGQAGGAGGGPAAGGGEAGGQQVAPTEKRVAVTGLAVFRDEKLVTKLSQEQTLAYLLATGLSERVLIGFGGPATANAEMVVELDPVDRNIEVRRNGAQVDIDLELRIRATILEVTSPVQVVDPRHLVYAKALLAAEIERRVTEVINLAKTEVGADFLGFSIPARRTFKTWAEWATYDWSTAFRGANVSVKAVVTGIRTGLIFQPFSPGG